MYFPANTADGDQPYSLGNSTTVTYSATDTACSGCAQQTKTCTVTVTVTDNEAPELQGCALDVVLGTTDTGRSYGTTESGVPLVHPTVKAQ